MTRLSLIVSPSKKKKGSLAHGMPVKREIQMVVEVG